jgi:CRISPR-associated endonuclease Csn1
MKKILGLDLGTNSIGWALVENDFDNKEAKILGAGSRIIPMSQDILGKFDSGQSISQTAKRTNYRSIRRLYQRANLRRDRLHRVLNAIGFLPKHYVDNIDFEKRLGQFTKETKINYRKNNLGNYEFLFEDSFNEMIQDYRIAGYNEKIPKDWTIYYLRNKALTKKISKYELAWIVLNFNQKRGYYQLRGEENDTNKNKEFVQLKVSDIQDTGEKGNKLYTVHFENGWVYDKPITNVEDWVGKTKEFIVTIKTLKNGEVKHSFKTVDSEKDWPAIKAKTEADIDKSNLTVGQYIYRYILSKPYSKIRGKLVKTIERKYYKKELIKILETQKQFHPELQDKTLFKEVIFDLYKNNDAHRNNIKDKDLSYLFIEDIIFYQRPLKSKKSTITGCQFEFRKYRLKDKDNVKGKIVKEPIKAVPKSHPIYQEFRLWQFISNIQIIDINKEVHSKTKQEAYITTKCFKTQNDYVKLYEYLNDKKEVGEADILKYLVKNGLIPKDEISNYQWNYVRDKKYPCNPTRNDLLNRLKKVNGISPNDFLTKEKEEELWHIIYSVKDKFEFEKALSTFSSKNNLDVSFVEAFKNISPYPSDYGTLSLKAIKKLLALMRMGDYWSDEAIDENTLNRIHKIISGEYDEKIKDRVRDKSIHLTEVNHFSGLPLWLASYIVYDRHSELGDIQLWHSPDDINCYLKDFKQHSLRNPIVEQVVTETLRTVRDIWQHFGDGEANYFDKIHLELGREVKNSAEKRKNITSKISENQRTNERIIQILENLAQDHSINGNIKSYSPSHQEILKLYEEGIYQNPLADYSKVSEDEIEKIRRNNKPSKSDIIKYKLWLEQGYISPYTGKLISLSKLFTTEYEIEHIIPQSRYFDNSMGNKVICETDVNSDKGNMTAYEYLSKKGGETVDGHTLLTLEEYETHVNQYFKRNRTKLRNLLSFDIPEGFINRQLNDSRYISKFVKGLLSNIVREEGENEATSKHLQPFSGTITAKLRQDWGLNDKWNEIVAPRFKRLNQITESNDFGYFDKSINAFRIQVPDELRSGFSSKRIDHRHHALDAIVIACTTKDHVNYLTSLETARENHSLKSKLLLQNKHGDFTRNFQHPWKNFTTEVKDTLETIIVSFKQNTRVINKTNNKIWKWIKGENGNKKTRVKQTKGDNWAIRKSLHLETVAGLVTHIDAPKGKIVTSTRVSISDLTNEKHIDKIVDPNIQKILRRHLTNYKKDNGTPDYKRAFSELGIEELNQNITKLNGGKRHMPIKKVKQYEIGSKFPLGHSGNNSKKYVEAAKGTNLFFAIYWNEKKKKRSFESVPLNEVIEHQKQVAHLPKKERLPIQPNPDKGRFLFTLSPNDLVYVPSDDELDSSLNLNYEHLNVDQIKRIYKMVSCTGGECHFIPAVSASEIAKNENGTNSKSERIQSKLLSIPLLDEKDKGIMIKNRCWKIKVDRLGNIIKVV